MSSKTSKARDYADRLRGGVEADAAERTSKILDEHTMGTSAELVPTGGSMGESIEIYTPDNDIDLAPYTHEEHQQLLKQGGIMGEKFMVCPVGKRIRGYIMGFSAAVVNAPGEAGRLSWLPKMHLELLSGARVSHLAAAQLMGIFRLPSDGSCGIMITRGEQHEIDGGKRMGEWGWIRLPNSRDQQHEPGSSYEEQTSRSQLHEWLSVQSVAVLESIKGAPSGTLERYLETAHKREADIRALQEAQILARAQAAGKLPS